MEVALIRLRVPPKQLRMVLCGLLQSVLTQPSLAAEWSLEPSITSRADYNDNILLTSQPHSSVRGIIFSPEAKLSGQSETLKITGGLKLNFNRYWGEEGLDTDDRILTFRSSYRTERDVLRLDLDAVRDSTLLSELATTGVVQARRQRSLLKGNPSWSRSLSETTAITVGYDYRAVDYSDTGGTSLIDYREQTASVGVRSTLSPRNVLTVAAFYDRFETDPADFRARTYGFQIGFDHEFSETLRGSMLVGARKTESKVASQTLVCTGSILFGVCFGELTTLPSERKETSSGYTLNTGIEKRFETATVTGRVSREIHPTALGSLVQTDRLSIAGSKQWSPALSGHIDASVYRSSYIGDIVSGSNSRYYTIQSKLSWRMSERWMVDAGYSRARLKYDNVAVAATANAVYIGLSYIWQKVSVSR